MPITRTDLLFKLSTTAGSAGNSQPQVVTNNSLGKYISTSQIAAGNINNLFDNISGSENSASQSDYRCVFVHNSHATLTLLAAVAWIAAEVPGGADCSIGVDPTPAGPIGQVTSQAVAIGNETTAPAGVTFSSPTTKSAGVVLGDIPAGHCRALWIKRTATNSAALNTDGVTVSVEGDTAA